MISQINLSRSRSPSRRTRDLQCRFKTQPHPALLLKPHDHTLIMIDFQSQMAIATSSIDELTLRNNVALVAHAAAGFSVSTIVSTETGEDQH
jgi:hypothetical protein